MNPTTLEEAKDISSSVKRSMRGVRNTSVVICPPFVYLAPLSSIAKAGLFLGAQNANSEAVGPLTGEVSFSELSQFKVKYVLIGHSERRKMGETDEIINKKVKSIVSGGMTAIICVGENSRDQGGEYFNFIRQQIQMGLKDVSKKFLRKVVIAYEPVWAIGAREAIGPRDLHEMSIFIKKILRDMYGVFSEDIRIIYGGTADRANADTLVRDGRVNGLLVGRESLRAKDFIEIIKLVDEV